MLPIAALIGLLAGCGDLKESPTDPGGGEPPPDPSATFTRVQGEILTPSCALLGCHDARFPQENLILATGQSYALIVNVPSRQVPTLRRIEPSSPDQSYLYLKVTGATGIVGVRMPQTGSALNAAQLQLLRDWIRRGAPND